MTIRPIGIRRHDVSGKWIGEMTFRETDVARHWNIAVLVRYLSTKVGYLLRVAVLPCANCGRYKEFRIFQKKSYFLWKILLGVQVKQSAHFSKWLIFSEILWILIIRENQDFIEEILLSLTVWIKLHKSYNYIS